MAIDEISALLGQLREENRQAQLSRQVLHEKIDKISSGVGEIAQLVQVHEHRIDKMEPVVSDLERMKNKGLGVLACVAVVGGSAGAAISHYVARALAKGIGQ